MSLWLISAHALRYPPGWAAVSKSVSVWSSCGWVWDQRSLLATLYDLRASQRGFASNNKSIHVQCFFDSWSENKSVVKRWLHITDLGQNPGGRSDQGVKNVHVSPVRSSPSSLVYSLLRRKRAHSSLCRLTNQRAQNRNVYWSMSVTRHQSPPPSSFFHVITHRSFT